MPLDRNGQCNHVLRHLHLKAWFLADTPAGKMAVHSTLGSLGTNLCQVWFFPVASGQVVREVVSQVGPLTVEGVGIGVAPSSTLNTPSGVKQGEMAIQGL